MPKNGGNARDARQEAIRVQLEVMSDLYTEPNYKGSLEHCDIGLALDPGNTDMLLHKALLLHKFGCFRESLKYQRDALEKRPKHVVGIVGKVYLLLVRGRIGEANEFTDAKLEEHRGNRYVLYRMADMLQKMGQHGKAVECYDAMLMMEQDDPFTIIDKAHSLERLGRFEEALECHETMLDGDSPGHPERIAGKIRCLRALDKTKKAEEFINAILEENRDDPHVLPLVADILREMGQHGKAIECYDAKLGMNPDDYDSTIGKAHSLCEIGRFDEALKNYEAALDGFVARQGIEGKIRCLRALDKTREMDEFIYATIRENQDDGDILFRAGEILRGMDRHEKAIKCYDAAQVVDDPEFIDTVINKARSLYEIGRFEDAIRCLDQSLDEEYGPVMLEKARMLETMGRYEEASACFDRMRKESEADATRLIKEQMGAPD